MDNQNLDRWEEEMMREQQAEVSRRKSNMRLYVIIGVFAALALAAVVWFIIDTSRKNREEVDRANQMIEQLQLEKQMLEYENSFSQIDSDYNALMEGQTQLLANDSIVEKYQAARAEIERLMAELQNERSKSADEIAKLKRQIETLQGICRDYLRQIQELTVENQRLVQENDSVKRRNSHLSNQVAETRRENEHLAERMTLAEKLNVTGVNLVALNKKGKNEKNITKAVKLMVTFTIPQNNSTPPGEKTIYLRITSPEGNLLSGNGSSFSFEGSNLQATARTTIEYANEEIGGIQIYWDVNTALTPGDYKVELFADNYRLASRNFIMKK